MEGDSNVASSKLQDENQLSDSSGLMETKTKRNYDDEVLVSKPTLSSKSTLQPDTLELR